MTAASKTVEYKRVVITGVGVVSALGIGKQPFLDALVAGRSGVRLIERFDTTEYPVKIAAEVRDFDPLDYVDKKMVKRMDRFAQYGAAASTMALADSGYRVEDDPYGIGALIGSGIGGLDTFYDQVGVLRDKGPERVSPFFIPMIIPNMAAAMSSILLGLKGPVSTTCTACAAATNALGDAFNIVRRGEATAMLAGGAEAAVNEVGMSSFASLRALSTRNDAPQKASRPFDAGRDGFVMGEGSGVLVLEELGHALKRDAHIYAELVGYGMTGDAHHLTEPDETGEPAGTAVKRALADAGLDASEVDYVNAHGTSTPLGDKMETNAIKFALGDHASKVMISSNKSMFGHCLGAAGGLEAAATVLTMEAGKVAPTINLDDPDPACDLDYVPNTARDAQINVAVSNSFGFGGHNATIVIRRWHG
jgi:3-oxoacyl-[acyl-carrier-protein] synthase II